MLQMSETNRILTTVSAKGSARLAAPIQLNYTNCNSGFMCAQTVDCKQSTRKGLQNDVVDVALTMNEQQVHIISSDEDEASVKQKTQILQPNICSISTCSDFAGFEHNVCDEVQALNKKHLNEDVVEIESYSTAGEHAEKQHQPLQIPRARNLKRNNKRYAESTSEFAISSPSNVLSLQGSCADIEATGNGGAGSGAQTAGGSTELPQRTALLKNTIPADVLARNLAQLIERQPQLTSEEKVLAWRCDSDISDVDDVNTFDCLFGRREAHIRRIALNKQRRGRDANRGNLQSGICRSSTTSSSSFTSGSLNNAKKRKKRHSSMQDNNNKDNKTVNSEFADLYNFSQFRLRMLREFRLQPRLNHFGIVDRNVADRYNHEKPTTSAAACLAAQKRLAHATSLSQQKTSNESATRKRTQPVSKRNLKAPSNSSNGPDKDDRPPVPKKSATARKACKQLVQEQQVVKPMSGKKSSHKPKKPKEIKSAGSVKEADKSDAIKSKEPSGLIMLRFDFPDKKLHLKQKRDELFKSTSGPQNCIAARPLLCLPPPPPPLQPKPTTFVKGNLPIEKNNNATVKDTFTANVEPPKSFPLNESAAVGFHQQHVFCNYLGLTGMSTANAVANAVAELANSATTRRSLRVRHQQQKERQQQKSATTTTTTTSAAGITTITTATTTTAAQSPNIGHQTAEHNNNNTAKNLKLR